MDTSHNDQIASPGAPVLTRRAVPERPASLLEFAPFGLTFAFVAYIAYDRLFPLLSGNGNGKRSSSRLPGASIKGWAAFLTDRAAALTFALTSALAFVLAQLIFCEIADVFDPAARRKALEVVIGCLVASLIVVIPALEIHSLTSAIGFTGKSKWLLGILLDIAGLALWLTGFWSVGKIVLDSHHSQADTSAEDASRWNFYRRWMVMHKTKHGLSQGSLERVGLIGITLMASLAGFAAISSIWQSFGAKHRKVTDTDINRKQAGLDATGDLLATKESRLRALERRLNFNPQPEKSLMTRLVGSFRPDAETQEVLSLRMEISGLETMQSSLSSSLALLKSRLASQRAAITPLGRVCLTSSYIFSLYCIYRLAATTLTTFRRWWQPASTFASTDPITNSLALIAKIYDPTIDRAAWSRQIAFLLSGVMLLLSFNAVLQTVLLFSRFAPAHFVQAARKGNFALIVAQISATYVISSALLLRTNLPKEMGSVIEGALGAPLDRLMCERMFEGWFLGSAAVTAVGIWVGRKVGMGRDGDMVWDDDFDGDGGFHDGDLEGGKRIE